MNSGEAVRIPGERLQAFVQACMETLRVSPRHAQRIGDCLVAADLCGVHTHGVARLPVYAKRLRAAVVNATPDVRILPGVGGCAVVDGDNAPGPVAAGVAADEALRLARTQGVAWVGVRHSNHFGFASFYCERIARAGMIGLSSSSGEPSVAPWGGKRAFFANNPFALAAPTSSHPLVVDMATSVTARGRILLAQQTGRPIPEGWAVDAEGRPTTDPAAALSGSVLPMAGAKGYALIVALEVLCGVLTGGAFAPHVRSQTDTAAPAQVGHFICAIDPAAFMPLAEFIARIDRMLEELRAAPSAAGSDILAPGDRRQRVRESNLALGVPLHSKVIEELRTLGRELGLACGANL
ncbi:MAG TPA: Ldh family oxidoreductase [Ramlibacter sp.]|uniref:Ldh family oxidoreductase n=1 Tax=Ramlibacter sp. TaxID=1917967 RepID=UPI002C63C0D3|nr:Ldh family oxidoreductase [Ramlibacter sp.]HVZ45428.1 Ldh family oxidoreductase [Ramlibacter sp.]